MKSQTSLAARNCRLQEWSKMVHSCNNRPIGMSVDEWCRENSITTANYYYRMTQVRKACLDSLSDEAVNQEVVPVPMNLVVPTEEPCIKKLLPESVKGSSLEFDFHGATLRVTDQTSDALLAKVLGVLMHLVPVPGKKVQINKGVIVIKKNKGINNIIIVLFFKI